MVTWATSPSSSPTVGPAPWCPAALRHPWPTGSPTDTSHQCRRAPSSDTSSPCTERWWELSQRTATSWLSQLLMSLTCLRHLPQMRTELYFLSSQKNRPSLFGMPLIVPCTVHTSKKDLYDAVWIQVSRLASPLPPQEASNHAQDWYVDFICLLTELLLPVLMLS